MSNGVILVTGGSGFIGSHLCEKLVALGFETVNLDNFCDNYDPAVKENNISSLLNNPHYHLYRGDIRDHRILDRIFADHSISMIIHLAALAGVRQSLANPRDYVAVDVEGTVNLLEYAAKRQVKRFLFGSSSSVYGDNPVPFKESDRLERPLSPYAAAKISGELFCRTYHRIYGLPVVCLRFFTVYGPRQRPEMAIHHFAKLIDAGLEVPLFGEGNSERDYTYIGDILQGIIAAMEVPCSFEVFNLGNSKTTTLMELVTLLGETMGKQPRLKIMPVQPGDVPRTWADLSRSNRVLGYRPRVDLKEGIKRFVEWYWSQKGK
ncbi:MAG: NAD-dependent epimerase/dehydratase family protein [Firmicutes bacterium]|nr:NAD-dependent epimerase/dehydratase family protein [Bacillota bacterium]